MDFKYDSNGDIALSSTGVMSLEDKIEGLTRSRLNIRLQMNKGEWKFNIDFGLPWVTPNLNPQLAGKVDKQYIDSVLRKAILELPEITNIITFESTLDRFNRFHTLQIEARTVSGDIVTYLLEG